METQTKDKVERYLDVVENVIRSKGAKFVGLGIAAYLLLYFSPYIFDALANSIISLKKLDRAIKA